MQNYGLKPRIELAGLHHKVGSTVVYVTHDQVEAMTLANRIVVLNKGRVQQMGSPLELYNSPANIFVASFIGNPSMNFFEGELSIANGKKVFKIAEDLSIDFSTATTPAESGKYWPRPQARKHQSVDARQWTRSTGSC